MDIHAEIETLLQNAVQLHKALLQADGVDLSDVELDLLVSWRNGEVSVYKSVEAPAEPAPAKRGKKPAAE